MIAGIVATIGRPDQYQESCPKCQSWAVMTTDEWSEQDAFDEAIEEMEQMT